MCVCVYLEGLPAEDLARGASKTRFDAQSELEDMHTPSSATVSAGMSFEAEAVWPQD